MALSRDRKILLVLLVVAVALNVLGAPGLGIETRDDSDFPAWIFPVFLLVGFGPLAAVATLWKWPRVAAGIAIGIAVAAVAVNLADFAGLLIEEDPPVGLRILEVVIAALSVATIVAARRVLKEGAPATA